MSARGIDDENLFPYCTFRLSETRSSFTILGARHQWNPVALMFVDLRLAGLTFCNGHFAENIGGSCEASLHELNVRRVVTPAVFFGVCWQLHVTVS